MTNKLKYFIGNWKMFGDFGSFKIAKSINAFSKRTKKSYLKKKIVLCVPNTLIYYFNKKLKKKSIFLGAQNCHFHKKFGPFTGSVNASMLKNIGAEFVILGHSENRREGENNKIIKKKITSALDKKLNVIFCVGETAKEKKSGKTFSVLKKQITESLEKKINFNKIIFAYEPVWSIGTNKILKTDQLDKIIKFIKKFIKNKFRLKNPPSVLYGGSVNEKNISLFKEIPDLDGFLVGKSSQSSKKFIDIIKNYYK